MICSSFNPNWQGAFLPGDVQLYVHTVLYTAKADINLVQVCLEVEMLIKEEHTWE